MECEHSLSDNNKLRNYTYCKNCGTIIKIIKDEIIPISKRSKNLYSDIDNYEIYLNMKAQNLLLNIHNIQNSSYLANRKDLIEYLRTYSIKYKFSDRSLHLAILLLDLLSCNDELVNQNDIELLSISCLILAGK